LDDIKQFTSFTEKTKQQQQQKPTFLTQYTEISDKNKQKSAMLLSDLSIRVFCVYLVKHSAKL